MKKYRSCLRRCQRAPYLAASYVVGVRFCCSVRPAACTPTCMSPCQAAAHLPTYLLTQIAGYVGKRNSLEADMQGRAAGVPRDGGAEPWRILLRPEPPLPRVSFSSQWQCEPGHCTASPQPCFCCAAYSLPSIKRITYATASSGWRGLRSRHAPCRPLMCTYLPVRVVLVSSMPPLLGLCFRPYRPSA